MEIRAERPEDVGAIRSLTQDAFRDMPFSRQTEAAVVDALREAGALTFSLVVVDGEAIVGHVAFSPVTISGEHGGWHGLGPISVRPDRQRQGTGKALIRDGLARLITIGASGCVTRTTATGSGSAPTRICCPVSRWSIFSDWLS